MTARRQRRLRGAKSNCHAPFSCAVYRSGYVLLPNEAEGERHKESGNGKRPRWTRLVAQLFRTREALDIVSRCGGSGATRDKNERRGSGRSRSAGGREGRKCCCSLQHKRQRHARPFFIHNARGGWLPTKRHRFWWRAAEEGCFYPINPSEYSSGRREDHLFCLFYLEYKYIKISKLVFVVAWDTGQLKGY